MPSVKAVAPLTLETNQVVASQISSDMAVFIGPQKSFTQTVMRIVDEEIDDVCPVRHETVTEFLNTLPTMSSPVRVIIVDACLCENVIQDVKELAHADSEDFPMQQAPGVVVAYWNECQGKHVFEDIGGTAEVQGFLPMNQNIDIWLAVMRLFLSGGTYFPPELQEIQLETESSTAAEHVATDTEESKKDVLTQREVAVMEEVVNGLQNKQIAAKLKVSEHTIKLHIHHIITKLQVSNRTAAAMKFVDSMQHCRP